jgi:hypothetical protein
MWAFLFALTTHVQLPYPVHALLLNPCITAFKSLVVAMEPHALCTLLRSCEALVQQALGSDAERNFSLVRSDVAHIAYQVSREGLPPQASRDPKGKHESTSPTRWSRTQKQQEVGSMLTGLCSGCCSPAIFS